MLRSQIIRALPPREKPQGVQDHHDGAALVNHHRDAQGDCARQRGDHQQHDDPERNHEVLADDAGAGPAQSDGEGKLAEIIAH